MKWNAFAWTICFAAIGTGWTVWPTAQAQGVADDPANPNTVWISPTTWDSSSDGGVFKTSDGGVTWQEITSDLPYRKPLVLRFNPTTRELWAAGVGLFKLKQ